MSEQIRIDKWLWHARFYRTRALAQSAAGDGMIRLNGRRVEKPSVAVEPGDVLTLPVGRDVITVRVCHLAVRRGTATDARQLYQILDASPA